MVLKKLNDDQYIYCTGYIEFTFNSQLIFYHRAYLNEVNRLQDNVRESLLLTTQLSLLWAKSDTRTHPTDVIWRVFVTRNGVMRWYPGISGSNDRKMIFTPCKQKWWVCARLSLTCDSDTLQVSLVQIAWSPRRIKYTMIKRQRYIICTYVLEWLILYNWYNKLNVVVKWNGLYSKSFSVTRGTQQGSVLSPYLFKKLLINLY